MKREQAETLCNRYLHGTSKAKRAEIIDRMVDHNETLLHAAATVNNTPCICVKCLPEVKVLPFAEGRV